MEREILINIASLLLGWLLGFLQPAIIDYFSKIRKRRINRKSQKQVITYDPINDKVMLLHSWSFAHQLLPSDTKIIMADRPQDCPYIEEQNEFYTIANNYAFQNYKGNICYMIGYKVDHKDNHFGNTFEITVAPCDYSEALSVSDYLDNHPDVVKKIMSQVNKNPYQYFKQAIPSDIFINVIVVSEADNILVLRRSRAVASAQGKWCVGAFETMEYSLQDTAKADKNFHALTQRCLKEELNLYQQERKEDGTVIDCYDFNSIFISSISLSLYHMGTLITSIVKVKGLTEGEISQKISQQAHSKYEHDGIAWLPFNRKNIKAFVEEGKGSYQQFVENNGNEWIGYAKWSLYELARVYDFDKLK